MSCFYSKQAQADELKILKEEAISKQVCIEKQAEELRLCRLRIAELEGLVTLKIAVDSLTTSVQQQDTQHLSAADAQQRQLHAFNLALLEQAEELAALQALLGAPSRKRQSSRRRVTEDLMDSLDNLQIGGHMDRQLADPLSINLSTTSEASKLLKPVSELEADISSQSTNKEGPASTLSSDTAQLIQAKRRHSSNHRCVSHDMVAQMTERDMVLRQIAEMEAKLAAASDQSHPHASLADTQGFGSRPSQLGQGSPSEAHLSLSRQGSLRNHIAELRAQLAYGEAQEPNSSALPNASAAVPVTHAQSFEAPSGNRTTAGQPVLNDQQYAAQPLQVQEGFTKPGAQHASPVYGVQASPAYQGPMPMVVAAGQQGYPQQGYPQQGYPQQGYAPQGYVQGGAPGYAIQGPDNQRNFSGSADDTRSWIDAILFLLGFVFGIPWVVGAFLPLCRRPRWRSGLNLGFWIGNVVMTIAIIIAIIIGVVAVTTAARTGNTYYQS